MTAQRIVIAMQDFFRGGTERVALDLAARWSRLGRDVTIICGSEEGGLRSAVSPAVKVVTLAPPIRRSLVSRLRLGPALARPLAQLRPDLVFLPGNFHLPLAPALGTLDPRPVIAMKISNPPVPQGVAGLVVAPFFRHFARRVDGFAAMNDGLGRETARLVGAKSIVTLYDPVQVGPAPDQTHDSDAPCQIVWIGRLEPQKDVELALRSFHALLRDTPAHLTLLGDGVLAERTDRQIRELGLESHVTRHGHVPDVASHLARADMLLVTSHYEGGPAVAVEALALGTPVVTTDCSHLLSDVMTMPEAGRIVPSRAPQDLAVAMRLVAQAPRPPRAVLQGLTTKFAPDHCAQAYLDWFDALAASHVG